MTNVWDRLAGESDKAYSAFRAYLEMPERSLTKLARKLNRNGRGQLGNWSAKFNWVERAAAYDSSIVEDERKTKSKLRSEELKLQHELGMLMAQKALEGLKVLEVKRASPYALVQMADAACKILNTVTELESAVEDADKKLEIVIKKAD